jgi:hypothetical protein
MRDYRNAKAMAQTLRDDLSEKSLILSHSESLELVAHMLGLRDWNVLAARIDAEQDAQLAEAKPVEGNTATLRSCSFCRKTQHEVAKLIAGPAVFICDRCVGLCHDILIDELINDDPSYANITREQLVSKSAEELILLKARIGGSLSMAKRIRESVAPHVQNAMLAADARPSPQVPSFSRKSPEERRIYVSEIESHIGAMESAIAVADELLGKRDFAKSDDT